MFTSFSKLQALAIPLLLHNIKLSGPCLLLLLDDYSRIEIFQLCVRFCSTTSVIIMKKNILLSPQTTYDMIPNHFIRALLPVATNWYNSSFSKNEFALRGYHPNTSGVSGLPSIDRKRNSIEIFWPKLVKNKNDLRKFLIENHT